MHERLCESYAGEPFVRVLPLNQIATVAHSAHSNFCTIGVTEVPGSPVVILTSSIDNLIKGASGQAVQNMNIMFGFDETAGLIWSASRPVLVLKIGGNQVEDAEFLAGFVQAVKALRAEAAVIVVHGGGKEIAELHNRFGVGFATVEGLRATSDEGMPLVEMALNGSVNTRLVAWLVNAGVDAIGLTGVDMSLVRVRRLEINGRSLGRVGEVVSVNEEALLQLLDLGLVPVVSPVSIGEDGKTYNVNADHVAMGVARAVEATRLIFVTNVPGVLLAGRIARALVPSQIEDLIAEGFISGGMIPKVRCGYRCRGRRGVPGGDHRPDRPGERRRNRRGPRSARSCKCLAI